MEMTLKSLFVCFSSSFLYSSDELFSVYRTEWNKHWNKHWNNPLVVDF